MIGLFMPNPRTTIVNLTRTAAVSAGRALFFGAERPLPPPGEIRRVLVVKIWAIGEVIMATPAFRALRELLPEAHITMLTGRAAYPVVELSPRFDKVLAVDEAVFLKPKPAVLLSLVKKLRRERYDLVVSLHHAWQFGVFAALTGARHRVGFDRRREGFAYSTGVKPEPGRHQVNEYFDLVKALGTTGEPGPLEIYTDESDEIRADEAMGRLKEAGKRAALVAPGGGVNPKTKMPEKRWPAERYAALIEMLAPDFALALVGGPGDEEAGVAVAGKLKAEVTNLIGRTTLRELYALSARADLFVGNDSAPMHLAAAAGAPTVAVFGPTDPTLNGPWSDRARVITRETNCAPCYRDGHFPECDNRRCLENVSAAEVYASVTEFLDSLKDK
jgi:predicted lipopolysaccharide heptosyltransferase III